MTPFHTPLPETELLSLREPPNKGAPILNILFKAQDVGHKTSNSAVRLASLAGILCQKPGTGLLDYDVLRIRSPDTAHMEGLPLVITFRGQTPPTTARIRFWNRQCLFGCQKREPFAWDRKGA